MADRACSIQELARKGLVHNHYLRRAGPVARIEIPPGQQRDLQRPEVFGADPAEACILPNGFSLKMYRRDTTYYS